MRCTSLRSSADATTESDPGEASRRAPLLRAGRRRPAVRRTGLAALALALAAPGAALADVTVSRSGDAVVIAGSTSGETEIGVRWAGAFTVATEGVGITAGAGCTVASSVATCGPSEPAELSIALGGPGADSVLIGGDALEAGALVDVDTGPGDDTFDSSAFADITVDLGSGDDAAFTAGGDDYAEGGPGDDLFDLGLGDDQGFGDAGNDRWLAGPAVDGSDAFDGGTDMQTSSAPLAGDSVSYEGRVEPVRVTLPADAVEVPAGNNGEEFEGDRLARVENATGSEGRSTLAGNERPNQLTGGDAGDTLSGGAGADLLIGHFGADGFSGGPDADTVRARAGETSQVKDTDSFLECGAADDVIARDFSDPRGVNCERDAPGFVQTPFLLGSTTVNAKLLVDGIDTFGDKATQTITWWSCNTLGEECKALIVAESYQIEPTDVGRELFAEVTLSWPFGPDERAVTDLTSPVRFTPGAAGGTVAGQPGGPPGRGPAAAIAFTQSAAQQAVKKLGAGAALSQGIALGQGTASYEAAAGKGGLLVLRGTEVPIVAGIACEKACTLTVNGTLVVVPKAKKGKGRKKAKVKNRVFKLRPQVIATPAGSMSLVRANVTSAQRKLIKRSRKAKLTLSLSVKYADGTTRTARRSYLVKVK